MRRPKVLLYHNVMAPYRDALFRAISELVNLDVWFSARTTRDRDWGKADPEGYKFRVLTAFTLYGFNRPLITTWALAKQVSEAEPDVVVAVLTRSNILDVLQIINAARRLKVPLVLWIGNVPYLPCFNDDLPPLISKAFDTYYRYAIRHADAFLYYSSLSQEWAQQRGASGPSVVGTQVLEAPVNKPRLDIPGREVDPLTLLFVGKLEERKGLDLLLDCLNGLSPEEQKRVQLVVAGAGRLERTITMQGANLAIHYLGHVTRDKLSELYRKADLFVLPSRHDPWGFVVNEAMATGTPALVSSGCGAAELATRAGWIFDPCDVSDLLTQLRVALGSCRNPQVRDQAVRAEALYRPESCAERMADLLNQMARR
jgi:glycosyltransferase involved in cell wall biosynthesis